MLVAWLRLFRVWPISSACSGCSALASLLCSRNVAPLPSFRWAILASVTADLAGFFLIWALYTHQISAPYPIVWLIFVLAYGCNAGCALFQSHTDVGEKRTGVAVHLSHRSADTAAPLLRARAMS